MKSKTKLVVAVANQGGAMEPETINKTGRSSKSLMSRGNFLRKVCFGVITVGILLSGCNKDNDDDDNTDNSSLGTSSFDGKVTATVENGSAYNSNVKQVVAFGETSSDYEELVTGNYADGGFTLTFPAKPAAKFLFGNFEYMFGGSSNVNISDKNVKLCHVASIEAYDSDGEYVDDLYYCKFDNNSYTFAFFIYAEKDLTVTGSYKEDDYTDKYSVSFKEGWNVVYLTESETETEISTKTVSGLKWYFAEELD